MHLNPRALVLVCALAFLSGCARYEYDLVQPPELRRHVGTKTDEVIKLDPIEYKLRTVDSRLVISAYNRTDQPMQLLGDQSIVVAPDGESHPIRGRTFAPGSHVKLIFPPPRPRLEHTGPTFGVGVGVGVSHNRYRDVVGAPPGMYDSFSEPDPAYLTMYEPAEALYWDWNGQTEAHIILVYRRADSRPTTAPTAPADDTIRHEFTFHRKKM
jgi:hypothetical protein